MQVGDGFPYVDRSDGEEEDDGAESPIPSRAWQFAAGAIVLSAAAGSAIWLRKRFPTANHLPPRYFLGTKRLRGVVLAVNDGDNVRVYHTPLLRYFSVPQEAEIRARRFLTENTIHVRLAGVDAPESAYFGKPGQPFSREAKEYLRSIALGKRVTVHVLARDQYHRVVGTVHTHQMGVPWTNLSLSLVRAGLATIYDGANAVHGNYLRKLQRAEAQAKRQKIGMWSLSASAYESPMAFKRRVKGTEDATAGPAKKMAKSSFLPAFLAKLFKNKSRK